MSMPVSARADDVEITACPRGAHLMTWTTAGVERLWMSPMSTCGDAGALRGGVPVLFPQFGAFGPLGKHGFARTALWRVTPVDGMPGHAVLAFELSDSHETRAVWPAPFQAQVVIDATASTLTMTLSVTNADDYAARFTAGLHTYLAVSGAAARVTGLAGGACWDGVSALTPTFDGSVPDSLPVCDEQDFVVHDVTGPVRLDDPVLGRLTVTAQGFPDRVVWNPGPGHRLPDVPPGGEAGFVCVEPVVLTPVELAAGATWVGVQQLTVG